MNRSGSVAPARSSQRRTGGRQRVDVELTLLADQGREEGRVDAELLGLGFDRRTIGPGENRAQHARVAGREEGRLPAEPDTGRAVAAQTQPLAPREQRV